MNHNNSETHLIISKKAYTYFTLNNFEYFIITFEIKFLWSTSQFFFLKNDDPVQFLNFRKKDAWLMQRLLMSFGTYLNFLANYPKSKRLKQKLSNQNLVLDAQSLHKAQWYSNRSYIFFFSVLLIFCDYWCRVTEQWLLQVPQHHNRQKLQNFTCYCSIQFVSMIVTFLFCNRSKNNNFLVLEF